MKPLGLSQRRHVGDPLLQARMCSVAGAPIVAGVNSVMRSPRTSSGGATPARGTPVRSRRTRVLFGGHPGLARALLDIAAQEPAHDLRRRRVLLGAQPLEELLLARIDQDGQSCGAIFDGQRVSHEVTIGCARHYNKMHIVAIMKLAHSCKL